MSERRDPPPDDDAAALLARERDEASPEEVRRLDERYRGIEALIRALPAAAPGGPPRPRAGWKERVLAAIDAGAAVPPSELPRHSNELPVPVPADATAPVAAAEAELHARGDGAVAVGVAVPVPVRDPRPEPGRRWAPVAAAPIAAVSALAIALVAGGEGRGGPLPADYAVVVAEVKAETAETWASKAAAHAVQDVEASARGAGDDRVAPALTLDVMRAGPPGRAAPPTAGDTLLVTALGSGEGELRVYDERGAEVARCTQAAAAACQVRLDSPDGPRISLAVPLRGPGELRAVLYARPLGGEAGGLDADLARARSAGIRVVTREPVRAP